MSRAILTTALLLSGCASEQRIQDRWDRFVDEHNTCEVAADCDVVYPGCPLGCWTAVRADAVDEAQDLAASLIRRYELPGRECMYDCAPHGEPFCDTSGRCAVEEDWTDSGF